VTPADDFGLRPGIPAPEMRVVRRLRYKQNGAGWMENRYRHIHVLDLDSGDVEQVTDGECDYVDPCWSWDGHRIAIAAFAREQNTLLGQGQILILDWQTGEIEALIPDWRGAAVSPQWRADDGAIAFAGYLGEPPVNRRRFYHVWLYDIESGQATDMTVDQDQTVGNYAVSDQRPGLTNVTVSWPSGKGRIYFLLTELGATHLCSVSQSAEFQREVGGHNVTFAYSPAVGGAVAYGQASPTNIGDLYLLRDGKSERLTDLNPWLRSRQLSYPREYWYQGLDDKAVHAWEIRPLVFREENKYPAIVYVHCSMFSWDFSHEFQCLANAGYVVAYFNQRGTTAGYGQEHAFGNYYGKHVKEFDEIMLGVDDLVRQPYVAPDRMGVTGGSCGGFMTNWIVGHTNRFAVAATQRSVVNLVSKFGTSDNGPEQATSEGAEAPWVDVDTLWRSSPLAYAHQVRTPLLIVHSEEDHRCPLSQAEELFAALRWLGREVELIVFEGEHHGLSRSGRPGNRIERQRRIMAWFKRYLGQSL
jgi:dipeptidyl aminopeptidase/acylaminoacyl peptidase